MVDLIGQIDSIFSSTTFLFLAVWSNGWI
jgi:hypothetical protein